MSGQKETISSGQHRKKKAAYVFNNPSMEVLPVFFLLERLRLTEERPIDRLDTGPPHQLRRGKRLDKVTAIQLAPR